MSSSAASLLVLEAFYGGSHKHLLSLVLNLFPDSYYCLLTLPATKWHWRSRCSSLYFAQKIPTDHKFKKVFITSCTNLGELIGLRPDLSQCEKVLYFHENQLVYPRKSDEKDRDYQHSYNEVVSALAADKVIFNTSYNMRSFLDNCDSLLKKVPETSFEPMRAQIEKKCDVLPVPIDVRSLCGLVGRNLEQVQADEGVATESRGSSNDEPIRIVWPHRWEHDKNPDMFRDILFELENRNCDFQVSILGEKTTSIPESISKINSKLKNKIVHFGFLSSKEEYYKVLSKSDIVLSTANHEFQGLAVMEAAILGCYPLCPNRLAYPEYLPEKCLYNTPSQAVKFLANACRNATAFRKRSPTVDLEQFSFNSLSARYEKLLGNVDFKS